MKIAPSKHKTKQGNKITIREAKVEDAAQLIECTKSYIQDGFIPLTESEFNPTTKEREEWIKDFIDNKNSLLLVAELNGIIIGNIDLTAQKRKMLNHTVHVGMGIHQEWQNQGIGTLMMNTIKEWSKKNPTIEILWLQTFSNNLGAIHLYKKSGFVENGRQRKFIKTEKGKYIDNVIMTLNL